jgi:hypothetical protein
MLFVEVSGIGKCGALSHYLHRVAEEEQETFQDSRCSGRDVKRDHNLSSLAVFPLNSEIGVMTDEHNLQELITIPPKR